MGLKNLNSAIARAAAEKQKAAEKIVTSATALLDNDILPPLPYKGFWELFLAGAKNLEEEYHNASEMTEELRRAAPDDPVLPILDKLVETLAKADELTKTTISRVRLERTPTMSRAIPLVTGGWYAAG